jgi:hypothetical protein
MAESNYDRYVMGQTMGKFGVISVHLWLEYLLAQCLRAVVPDADPLFRDRGIAFPQLVSLCEAHRVLDKPLADILRNVNALRNKCAHQLTFNPGDQDWKALAAQIEKVVPESEREAGEGPLRPLADFLEKKAIAIGAIKGSSGSAEQLTPSR